MSMDIIIGAVAAAVVVLMAGPILLPILRRLKFGQSIRQEGPQSHQAKSGTPTMGGIMIVGGITIGTLVAAPLNTKIGLALFIMLGHFLLGFLDDYIKVVKKRNLGLRAKEKLAGQIFIAVVTIIIGTSQLGLDTVLWLPGSSGGVDLGVLYYLLIAFVLVGASNAVNLTDGLDGLAAGTMGIASFVFVLISLVMGQTDLAIFAAAVMGACLAFLRFNAHPAQVFMGDTGSLALGGAFAAMGILLHREILLAVVGVIFVAEALSVILQVISYQTTGKRIFRMSPLHHHFELGGWSEWKVVRTFWFAGLVAGAVGLIILL